MAESLGATPGLGKLRAAVAGLGLGQHHEHRVWRPPSAPPQTRTSTPQAPFHGPSTDPLRCTGRTHIWTPVLWAQWHILFLPPPPAPWAQLVPQAAHQPSGGWLPCQGPSQGHIRGPREALPGPEVPAPRGPPQPHTPTPAQRLCQHQVLLSRDKGPGLVSISLRGCLLRRVRGGRGQASLGITAQPRIKGTAGPPPPMLLGPPEPPASGGRPGRRAGTGNGPSAPGETVNPSLKGVP